MGKRRSKARFVGARGLEQGEADFVPYAQAFHGVDFAADAREPARYDSQPRAETRRAVPFADQALDCRKGGNTFPAGKACQKQQPIVVLDFAEGQVHFGADGGPVDVSDAGFKVAHGREGASVRGKLETSHTCNKRVEKHMRTRVVEGGDTKPLELIRQ